MFFLGIICVLLCGCMPTKFIDRQYYLFNVPIPCKQTINHKKPYALLNHTTIAAAYDQLNFLYRINNNQYVTDYYHGFLVSPASQLDTISSNYFKAKASFYPLATGTAIPSKIIIQPRITEIYADYRDRNHPRAILAMQFIVRNTDDPPRILLDKTFRTATELTAKTTECLLAAWNEDLRIILNCAARAVVP